MRGIAPQIKMERIKILNDKTLNAKGKYVLYWMQTSKRVSYNLALYEAIKKANEIKKPLLVIFVLNEDYPFSNRRNFKFLLEGLKDVYEELRKLNIRFIVIRGDIAQTVIQYSQDASILFVDVGYTKFLLDLRKNIIKNVKVPVVAVEDNVVVPVEITSNKEEYGAFTIRKKIEKHLPEFLKEVHMEEIHVPKCNVLRFSFDVRDTEKALRILRFKEIVAPSSKFVGGYKKAKELLKEFINDKLPFYKDKRNDFTDEYTSNLSPYLHFGQISPIEIALEVLSSSATEDNKKAFLEELIIRRELAVNFVYYNHFYNRLEGLQPWAYKTLKDHQYDEKPYRYSLFDFENAKTHDELWNAAQMELVKTGKIHSYLRMYWGKKVIEWSESNEFAFKYLEELNNKYALDGRDPNTYAGIAWCFGKHDRPFKERPIFGKVRYMSATTIRKKFDVEKYIERIKKL